MLIPFPLGAFGFSIAMDACHTATGRREHAAAARRALDFGLASALLAAPFGVMDYLGITPGTRAKRIGALHAAANVLMLGCFATSRVLRARDVESKLARGLSASAFLVSGVAAWLGGELVTKHAIGVSSYAHQDAPHSLAEPPVHLTNENYAEIPPERTHDWGGPDGL